MTDIASKKHSLAELDAHSIATSGVSSLQSAPMSETSIDPSIAPSAAISIDFSPALVKERLAKLVYDSPLRFAWFVGNLISVIATIVYGASYRSAHVVNRVFYRFIFLGALDTFGIVVYQKRDMISTDNNGISFFAVLEIEDFHYFYSALTWLCCPVEYTLAIVPFFAFSVFHAASFIANDVLHTLGMFHGLSRILKNFAGQYHESSKRIAAGSELMLFAFLILKAIFFRKWAWITLLMFSIFIKLKTETSIYTKSILKNWEVRVDGLVSGETIPPFVKVGWVNFKKIVKQVDQVSIVSRIDVPDKKEE